MVSIFRKSLGIPKFKESCNPLRTTSYVQIYNCRSTWHWIPYYNSIEDNFDEKLNDITIHLAISKLVHFLHTLCINPHSTFIDWQEFPFLIAPTSEILGVILGNPWYHRIRKGSFPSSYFKGSEPLPILSLWLGIPSWYHTPQVAKFLKCFDYGMCLMTLLTSVKWMMRCLMPSPNKVQIFIWMEIWTLPL